MGVILFLFSLFFATAELEQCRQDFAKLLSKVVSLTGTDQYSLMALYSGFKRNNLGDYSNCADLDYADYVVIRLKESPSVVITLCGSKNCTESDYYTLLSSNFTESLPVLGELIQHQLTDKISHVIKPMLTDLQASKQIRKEKYRATASPVQIIYPQDYIEEHFGELNPGAIVMIVLCSILILITFVGTAFDILYQKKAKIAENSSDINYNHQEYQRIQDSSFRSDPHIVIKLLMCFSLYTNIQKLFVSRSSEKTGARETLDILNGVRVMSISWIVLGHVFVIKFGNSTLVNFENIGDWFKNPKGGMVYGARFAVDVFFWLSGFLMAYLFIMEYNAKKRMNWIYIYVHRFYRILPAYMFCLFLTWAFLKYIGNGPMWYDGDIINNDCKNYWWTNLLFLNNFIPDGDGNGCMGWSWYLANDMQFFLITPVILYIYHKIHKLIGWAILLGLVFTNLMCSGLISSHYNYSVVPDEAGLKIYVKPYCRVGAYAVGAMFGLIFYTHKHDQKTGEIYDPLAFRLSKLVDIRPIRYFIYALGLFLINYLIFIQCEAYHDYFESIESGSSDPQDYWAQDERNAFYSLSRTGYATGIGLILLPILMGHNKIACAFLGHAVFTPLARLSFCVYLIHYGLLHAIILSRPQAGYLSDTEIFYDFLICLVLSFVAALPISLVLESPLLGIEKLLKGTARTTQGQNNKVQ